MVFLRAVPLRPNSVTSLPVSDTSIETTIYFDYTASQCSAFKIVYQGNGTISTDITETLIDCSNRIEQLTCLEYNTWYSINVMTLSKDNDAVPAKSSNITQSGAWTCKYL